MIPKLLLNEKSFQVTSKDLSMFIHGEIHSGASYCSLIIIASLILQGSSVLFYSAFSRGIEALQQLVPQEAIAILKRSEDIETCKRKKILAVSSGNELLLQQSMKQIIGSQRIIFIKNIETLMLNITALFQENNIFIISGDIERYRYKKQMLGSSFTSKILFSNLPTIFVNIPPLEKYQGIFLAPEISGIIQVTNQKL